MVVLVMFALKPGELTILFIVVALTVAMFTNLKFIHPVRTERWRALSLSMALAWVFFAAWAAWVDFDPKSWAHWGLVITSLYLCLAGVAQQIVPPARAR
jgi:phosphatidylcholine synthase